MLKPVALYVTAAAFALAGVMHFVRPEFYERLIPPALPYPRVLNAVSGVAEIAGGVGLLVPRLRRPAGIGLIALLIAVFPANLYMAVRPERFADLGHSPALYWIRLPLQFVLIAWVWLVSVRRPATGQATPI